MYTAEFTPTMGELRIYIDGGSYAKRSPYITIVNVQILDKDTVYLRGAKGKLNMPVRRTVMTKLKALGFKHVMDERHGKRREYDI